MGFAERMDAVRTEVRAGGWGQTPTLWRVKPDKISRVGYADNFFSLSIGKEGVRAPDLLAALAAAVRDGIVTVPLEPDLLGFVYATEANGVLLEAKAEELSRSPLRVLVGMDILQGVHWTAHAYTPEETLTEYSCFPEVPEGKKMIEALKRLIEATT